MTQAERIDLERALDRYREAVRTHWDHVTDREAVRRPTELHRAITRHVETRVAAARAGVVATAMGIAADAMSDRRG